MDSWRAAATSRAGVAHSIVNGVGVLALTALHLWGSLSAEWAAGGILALCGLWAKVTRGGPPNAPPGASGLVAGLAALIARKWG